MSKLFDNKIIDGISKIADVAVLSFFFLACSIPLFTMGASASALYYATNKCIYKGRGYTTEFFHSFKDNFKQATISWLIYFVLFLILSGDIYISLHMISNGGIFAAAPFFFILLTAFVYLWAVFHFAYLARFENDLKTSFKNSAIIMVANLGWSLIILAVTLCLLYLVYRFLFLLLFTPGILACATQPIIEKVFRKYMSEEDIEKEDVE